VRRSVRWAISSIIALALLTAMALPALAQGPDCNGQNCGTTTPELPSGLLLAIPLVVAGVIWRVRRRR
jgi:MYXO-CTERM domain-containing protein